MIVLMRLYPKEKQDVEKIWDYLDQRFSSRATARKVRPLILSMQTRARFVSLFLETGDIENIGEVLAEEISTCPEVACTTTIPLLKMTFLPTPKEKPKNLKRFSVMVCVKPKDYSSIFKKVRDLKPGGGVFATFAAFLLGDYDVMLSMFSTSQKKVKEYVAQNVWKIDGVEEVKIFPIQKSKHLLSGEDWQHFQRTFMYVPPWVTDEVRDTLAFAFYLTEEDLGVSGAMKSES
jgi:hypothetical protein